MLMSLVCEAVGRIGDLIEDHSGEREMWYCGRWRGSQIGGTSG